MRSLWLTGLILVVTACAAPSAPPASTPAAASATQAPRAQAPVAQTAPGAASTRPPLDRVRAVYGAVTGVYLSTFMAKESGLMEQYGLDVDLQVVPGGPTLVQGMLAGEIQFAETSAPAPLAAVLEGGDTVYLSTPLDRPILLWATTPDVRRLEDLRNRVVGANRVGTLTYQLTRLSLGAVGLQMNRDVTVQQIGGQPELLGAMASNQVVAGLLAPPAHLQAIQAGMHVVGNVADQGILWPSAGVVTRRQQIAEQPERVRNYLRAYTEGLWLARADRDRALDVLMKYAQINDRATAAETYDLMRDRFILPGFPNPASFEVVVREDLAPTNPRALEMPIDSFYDDRILRELEQSGFLRELDTRYPGAR